VVIGRPARLRDASRRQLRGHMRASGAACAAGR
jgi:hypothetical protein